MPNLGAAVFDIKLVLEYLARIVPPFQIEERLSLWVGAMQLIHGCMQSVWKIVASTMFYRCLNDRLGHEFHPRIRYGRTSLVEKHDECDNGLVSVAEKAVIVRVDLTDGHIQKIPSVF